MNTKPDGQHMGEVGPAPFEWLINDLCNTVGDASPGELPELYSKLEELSSAIESRFKGFIELERLKAKREAYKHLNMTYWDDETDSIPCKDIDREIAELDQKIKELEQS